MRGSSLYVPDPWTGLRPPPITRSMATNTSPHTGSTAIPFRKMHGLGNDVVVLDARRHDIALTPKSARAIGNRRTGVGCDQIMIIERPRKGGDVYLAIRNSDGGVVESCGNGSRCVARLLL